MDIHHAANRLKERRQVDPNIEKNDSGIDGLNDLAEAALIKVGLTFFLFKAQYPNRKSVTWFWAKITQLLKMSSYKIQTTIYQYEVCSIGQLWDLFRQKHYAKHGHFCRRDDGLPVYHL